MPRPAFDNMRPDDAFWAARLVARFSDETIRAIVAKGRCSEPGAAEHLATTLIKRRDKVLRVADRRKSDRRTAADGRWCPHIRKRCGGRSRCGAPTLMR